MKKKINKPGLLSHRRRITVETIPGPSDSPLGLSPIPKEIRVSKLNKVFNALINFYLDFYHIVYEIVKLLHHHL